MKSGVANDRETRLEKFLMITSKDSKTISFVRLRKESSPTANAGKPVIVNMDASVTWSQRNISRKQFEHCLRTRI